MSKKNPFVNYTLEEIFAFEAFTYVIQVGSEIFEANGQWVFDKKGATRYYNKILKEIAMDMYSKNRKDRENAIRVMNSLQVVPLRFH